MKKLFLGLGVISIVVSMIVGLLEEGFFGFVYGIFSGVLSGGLYIGIAIVLDKLEELQQEIRYAGENARAAYLQTAGTVRCASCGQMMSADRADCPACGSGEFIGKDKTI